MLPHSKTFDMPRTILLLSVLLCTMVTLSSSRTFCPRIFFQNIDEKTMPYKMIEGVYAKQNYDHNNFPVYRRERDNLTFYFSNKEYGYYGLNRYVFGVSLNHSFGVAAEVFGFSNPTAWPASGSLNRNDVFKGLVRDWLYYDKRRDRWRRVQSSSSSPMIKAVCVDEDFRECNSDRVYLNESFTDARGNTLNDPARDYFYRKPGMFRNLRPVYEHSKQSWYLQYVDGYWVVTAAYVPRNSEDRAYMRVKDPALRPEFISKTWSIHFINIGWRDRAKLRVLCRGVTAMSNSCPSKPCHGNATCVYTSRNDTLCLCPPGYTGVKCSVNKQCPTPTPIVGKELNVVYHGKRPGDLGVSFCSTSYPSVRFSLCVDGRYYTVWNRRGIACGNARNPSTTYTRRPWNTATSNPWFTYTPGTRKPWKTGRISTDDSWWWGTETRRPWNTATPNPWFTYTPGTRKPWKTGGISTDDSWWGTETYTAEGRFGSGTDSFDQGESEKRINYSSIIIPAACVVAGLVIIVVLPLLLCRNKRRYRGAILSHHQYTMGPVCSHQPDGLHRSDSHRSFSSVGGGSSGGGDD